MRDVFGARNWIYWWAALTSSVFLKDWLPTLAQFFQDSGFFSPTTFPFSLVSGLNDWLDSVAVGIQNSVQFDPNSPIITSPITVPNWMIALIVGLLVLGGAVGLYVRALRSSSLGDDILTLLALYFILRIEAYIIGLTNVGPLQGAGNIVIQNPLSGFWVIMFFLFVLVFMGGGLNSRRAFWRGLLEAILLALFVVPTQTADVLSLLFSGLYAFATLLGSNLVFGIVWGVLGAILALTRLTSTGPSPA
ncbi:MAG TPA: hypothetical protein VFD70_09825 [Anaerolineae bacterium]|nr:hypothetical protein [Anaerolineae bacterium]